MGHNRFLQSEMFIIKAKLAMISAFHVLIYRQCSLSCSRCRPIERISANRAKGQSCAIPHWCKDLRRADKFSKNLKKRILNSVVLLLRRKK